MRTVTLPPPEPAELEIIARVDTAAAAMPPPRRVAFVGGLIGRLLARASVFDRQADSDDGGQEA